MNIQIQVSILAAIMAFGLLALWVTAKELQKEMAGFLTQPNNVSTPQLYHEKPSTSMVVRYLEQPDIGDLVHASDPFYGAYVGEIVGKKTSSPPKFRVRILACMVYPKQHARFKGNWDIKFQRFPYRYNEIKDFHVDDIGRYIEPIPDYKTSLRKALENAFKTARSVEIPILEQHKRSFSEQYAEFRESSMNQEVLEVHHV